MTKKKVGKDKELSSIQKKRMADSLARLFYDYFTELELGTKQGCEISIPKSGRSGDYPDTGIVT